MRRGKMPKTGNRELSRLARMSDTITELAEFLETLPKDLKAQLNKGAKVEDLIAKHLPLLTARLIQMAASDPNNSVALAAIKDLLDRGHGRPTENRKVEHRFGKLPDEELDAVILAKMKKLEGAGE